MNNPLRTPEDYELFLYTIAEKFPLIRRSTLTLVRRGASLARVAGELTFNHGIRFSGAAENSLRPLARAH